ncbi:hypothetical protein ACLB2K_045509 [Fragaria x ananassa]
MVQRKVQTKLAIQVDPNVKFEKRLVNLKPSSQFQDGKNRGADLKKKKMKKSRSTKLSDIDSLRSPSPSSSLPLRNSMSLPGKPLPLNVQSISAAAVPLKQALTKTTDGSAPNYMKSTSCSVARKEKSQVSVRNSPVNSDSRNQNRRNLSNSKLSSGSINKPARTSSLKLVRTLIKSPSFKPARTSAKKNSRVALCEDVNIQKATCSSTLKDSKFPEYLMISPGGTEAEGTSVMKVCPYTYCSLNGHHHQPVTPLKCFLSARRREPNYLPLIPGPEAEKVDLRHQMLDEKKNAEEWMLDFAIQQAVTKLAPARKKKVALLVEAFEKLMVVTEEEISECYIYNESMK